MGSENVRMAILALRIAPPTELNSHLHEFYKLLKRISFVCQIKTLFEYFGAPQSQFSSDGPSLFSDLLYMWQCS